MAAKAGLGLLLEQEALNNPATLGGLPKTDEFITVQSPPEKTLTEIKKAEKNDKANEEANPDDSASNRLQQEMRLLDQDPAHKAKLLGLIQQNPFLTFKALSRIEGVALSPEGLECLAQRSIANRLLHEKDLKVETRLRKNRQQQQQQQQQHRSNSAIPLADLLKLLAMEDGTGH